MSSPQIYTLSLHDALPISQEGQGTGQVGVAQGLHRDQEVEGEPGEDEMQGRDRHLQDQEDRKSTRLNSSHLVSSYAVFCLKKNTRKSAYIYSASKCEPKTE